VTVAEFIAKWKRSDLKERSAAQEHFIDLCRLVGHPTPAEVDPTGATFCFEKGAAKHGGGDGFADVWKKDFFGWEYKGKHKALEAAYDQLLLYRDALESPPLLVVCDFERIVIHTNFTKTASATYEITLDQLGEPRNLEILRAMFFDPENSAPARPARRLPRTRRSSSPALRSPCVSAAWTPHTSRTSLTGLCSACSPRTSAFCRTRFSRASWKKLPAILRSSAGSSGSCLTQWPRAASLALRASGISTGTCSIPRRAPTLLPRR
jgi:hypothetical protein